MQGLKCWWSAQAFDAAGLAGDTGLYRGDDSPAAPAMQSLEWLLGL